MYAHRVADDDNARHAVTTDLAVAVHEVIDTERDATGVAEGSCAHCDDQAEPVDVMSGSDT